MFETEKSALISTVSQLFLHEIVDVHNSCELSLMNSALSNFTYSIFIGINYIVNSENINLAEYRLVMVLLVTVTHATSTVKENA